ncbi:MAG: hypothetical protein RIA09_16210 [Hoeflea sp.]|uniref:hypothetical protein n=1 Tax=Hoeflea sp. TaxID=1940281 RepID=UPI0032F09A9A
MSKSMITFLENLKAQYGVNNGHGTDWEDAYNTRSAALALQLKELANVSESEALQEQLGLVAEFYLEPVEDPEMGTPHQGDDAAIRDFAVAVLSLIQADAEFSDHQEVIDELLVFFTS